MLTFRHDHPKTAKSRSIVALPSFTAEAVRRRLAVACDHEPVALLFQSSDGTPPTGSFKCRSVEGAFNHQKRCAPPCPALEEQSRSDHPRWRSRKVSVAADRYWVRQSPWFPSIGMQEFLEGSRGDRRHTQRHAHRAADTSLSRARPPDSWVCRTCLTNEPGRGSAHARWAWHRSMVSRSGGPPGRSHHSAEIWLRRGHGIPGYPGLATERVTESTDRAFAARHLGHSRNDRASSVNPHWTSRPPHTGV